MPQCAVATCRNSHRKTKGRRVRYHRFPAEDDVRIRWVSVCGRGGAVAAGTAAAGASFNPSTARVCSLHFSPNSYERDVEHELLGLTPRSRLKKGAVPDRGVPITVPSLINKRRPPPRQRQQQQQVVTKGGRRKAAAAAATTNQKRPAYEDYIEEEVYPALDPNGFDVLLALGLIPSKGRREVDSLHDLNRMHIMEEDSSKQAAQLEDENGQKANGTSEKEGGEDKEEGVKVNGEREEGSTDGIEEEVETLEENKEVGEECNSGSNEDKIDGQPEPSSDVSVNAEDTEEERRKEARSDEGSEAAEKSEEELKADEGSPQSLVDAVEDGVEDCVDAIEEDSGNEDKASTAAADRKRDCSDSDSDTPSVVKKMKMSPAEYDQRVRTVNDYVESTASASLEDIQRYTEKIQQEVETLSAMARAKEQEWNNIIRLKKVKEEMFLRLQRKRQVMMIMMGTEGRDASDWELSSDMRYGECSGDSKRDATRNARGPGKSRNQMLLEQPTSTGISILKKNQHPNSLMMVPIVSSSPGNFAMSLSAVSQSPATGPLRVPEANNRDRIRLHRPILPKPSGSPTVNGNANNGQNPVIGEGRQGPILDVRSIIADYRQRHPETVPRRGRRLKSSASPTPNCTMAENLVSSSRVLGGGGILGMTNLALGSGSQMRAGAVGSTSVEMNDLGLLLSAVGEAARHESSRPSSADSTRSGAPSQNADNTANNGRPNISFKDVLVQFAKMSQSEQRLDHLPPANQPSKPPPYPDVTLHPVLSPPSPPHQSTSSSLLHGILTKSSNQQQQQQQQRADVNRPTTFSPTLARLLTAPERVPNNTHTASNNTHTLYRAGQGQVSISDLLSTSKQTRNEITITPVAGHQPLKTKQEVVLLEEEQEDSADRLVIDESADADIVRDRVEGDDAAQDLLAEDVPECQGCHQRTAQFVCAGCGNQWYCSRDCQVSAWDEHSDVCSG